MKQLIFIVFIILFLLLKIHAVTLLERFELPSNTKYFKLFDIKIHNKKLNNIDIDVKKKSSQKENMIDLKLTGILKIKDTFYAIINGDSYTIGNKINKYIIDNITVNKVVLFDKENSNKRIELKIDN